MGVVCVSRPFLVTLVLLAVWITATGSLSVGQKRPLVAANVARQAATPSPTPAPRLASRIVRQNIKSATLKRDMPFSVYLPAGYDGGTERYPVLYLLHGAGGDENDWTELAKVQDIADRLIATGAIPPTLIAMPGLPGCWWVDGAKDKAETAFWSDLVPLVDQRYRTIKSRDGRLVAGLSAGGYGAIRFGLKYPDRISAVAALSPAVYADAPPPLSAARNQPPFLNAGGGFDDGLWDANNYPSLLPAYFAQSNRVAIYLASGDDDNLGIAYETALLHKRLVDRQFGLTEFRILDGGHDWTLWSSALSDAMVYVFRHASPKLSAAGTTASPVLIK